jgi:hypothetical protein
MATYAGGEFFLPACTMPALGLYQKNSYSAFGQTGARNTTWTKLAEYTSGPYGIWVLGLDPDATYYASGDMRLVIDSTTVAEQRLYATAGYSNALVGISFAGLAATSSLHKRPAGPCFAESSFEVWGKTVISGSAYYWDWRIHYAEIGVM